MRYEQVENSPHDAEPRFDLPPKLAGRPERRMALRATADWGARHRDDNLPTLESTDLGADSEFAANSLLLDLRQPEKLVAVSIGAAVAAAFAIAPGLVEPGRAGGLAARLLDGCELVRLTGTAVPIEGALGGRDCACLLTRGVLMPLSDARGRLSHVHCVLSWKEVLDARTSAALRRELAAVLRAPANVGVFEPNPRRD